MSHIQTVRIYVRSDEVEALEFLLQQIHPDRLPYLKDSIQNILEEYHNIRELNWQPTGKIPNDNYVAVHISLEDYRRLLAFSDK